MYIALPHLSSCGRRTHISESIFPSTWTTLGETTQIVSSLPASFRNYCYKTSTHTHNYMNGSTNCRRHWRSLLHPPATRKDWSWKQIHNKTHIFPHTPHLLKDYITHGSKTWLCSKKFTYVLWDFSAPDFRRLICMAYWY
jgi:hypothetical protein